LKTVYSIKAGIYLFKITQDNDAITVYGKLPSRFACIFIYSGGTPFFYALLSEVSQAPPEVCHGNILREREH